MGWIVNCLHEWVYTTSFADELMPEDLVKSMALTKSGGLDKRYWRHNLPAMMWMDFIEYAHAEEYDMDDMIFQIAPRESWAI